ncbi:MAG: hypothetical protein RLZZ398_2082 [Verrucomicrobiota bacterium]|jgi:hypothetical protein
MKQNTSNRRPALLALLSITFATCSALAQKPESPSPTVDIEKSDPFLKSTTDAASSSTTETSVEMLNAQAQVLFARGETEKAIQLQNEAVAKAEKTLAKSLENLAKYQGRPGINEPIARKLRAHLCPPCSLSRSIKETIERKLREIIIPGLDFENTSLEEAIDFLQVRCSELDINEPNPAKKGLSFVVVKSRELTKVAPIPEGTPDTGTKELQIESLRLRNIPLGEALKHICEATGTRFEIDGQAVKIVIGAP